MNSLDNRETDLCIHGNWYKNGNDIVDPSIRRDYSKNDTGTIIPL